MNQDNSKVSIIIAVYNGARHIVNCLESIQKSTYQNYEIIVVDNGSKDGSPDLIKKQFPGLRLILNKKNLGFTGGNNQGMKQAQGGIIFLLNDDTIIHPDLIQVLVQELESLSEIGIVGPKIYFMNEKDKVWFAGGKIDWPKSKTSHFGRDLLDNELVNDLKKEVDFITGCALMIKKEVIEKIGLLDDVFFAFYEDSDWCQKAKKAGYKVIYIPFGGVWHIKSATASTVFMSDIQGKYFRMLGRYLKFSIFFKWKNYRNRLIFFMRHAPFRYKILFLIRFIFIFTPKFLWSITGQTFLSISKITRRHIYESK